MSTVSASPSVRPPLGWYLAVAKRPWRRNLHAACYGFKTLFYASPFHSSTLAGRTPVVLAVSPVDPWPGDAERGRAMIGGAFTFAGRTMHVGMAGATPAPGPELWVPRDAVAEWIAAVNSFSWLRDLRVAGGEQARNTGRGLVLDWINSQTRWHRISWRPDVLASRLTAWISSYDFLNQGADPEFTAQLLKSLARQARHLTRAGTGGLAGARRLTVAKGRIFAAIAFAAPRGQLRRALARLEVELDQQILGDGGHVERSPAQQFAVLRDLVDIRNVLASGGQVVPESLQRAIDRMAPMLRFFRHGDGGLAAFNDSGEGEPWLIDMVLTRAEAPGKPLGSAPHSGFERVTANRTLLLQDTGPPPPPGARDHTFAGTLAFEMSIGKERLVVNCGGGPGLGSSWLQGLRATAAHSTLTLADTNSTEIFEVPGHGGEIGKHPERVIVNREEADGATWIDASHDGYVNGFGLACRRRLWLATGGDELRGEDSLYLPGAELPPGAAADAPEAGSLWRWRRGRPRTFHLRFHLHPGVKASLVHDQGAALLRLPSGIGWRFHAEGGQLALESSIYVASGEPQRCSQIVVTGGVTAAGPRAGALVKWTFRKVDAQ
jgi:uncharacterized heparinase superfamily protein